MCQRDCELTKDCKRIYYDPVHLECRLLFDLKKSGDATAPAVTRRVPKTSLTKDAPKICAVRDRVMFTKMGENICVQTKASKPYQEYFRLLLAKWRWCQLELKTRMVHEMNSPWSPVTCLAYLKTANRFVVSYRGRLFTTPVTDMKETALRRGISVKTIAADEARDMIFYK